MSAPGPSPAARARLFFALWPTRAIQARLVEQGRALQRLVGGKPTREESIHLTLAFLGEVGADRMDDVRGAGTATHFEPFALAVDHAGCWGHNGVAWVAPRITPAPLLALVARLESALQDRGFGVEGRPYAAHVTVVRKARCGPIEMQFTPVEWPVEGFVLVRSEPGVQGSRYTVINRWP